MGKAGGSRRAEDGPDTRPDEEAAPPPSPDKARSDAEGDAEELLWHARSLGERLRALSPQPAHASALASEIEALSAAAAERAWEGERPLVRQQARLRGLYKALAALESAPDWHSAPGSLSRPLEDLSPLSFLPGFNDYQRGYLPSLLSAERRLAEAARGPGGPPGRALLFSCGMGAIQTALQLWLGRGLRLLLGRRVYYETQTLLLHASADPASRPKITPLDEGERRPEALASALASADAVFLDTITLDREALRPDLSLLFQAIEASGREGLEIVLDNTAPGPALPLPAPPRGARLFIVESLLKHYQAGLDLCAAGMLLVADSGDAARDQRLVHDIEVLRSANGTNINPYNARLLPPLPRWLLLSRSGRQARNAHLLAEGLGGACEVSLLEGTGLLFCSHPDAEVALAVLERLALSRRVRLFRGTSFGFNDTRASLPPGQEGEGQVRFACGTEHRDEMARLIEIARLSFAAAADPEVASLCFHLSRLFPGYPRETRPTAAALEALEQHLSTFEEAVSRAARKRGLAPG